MADRQTESALLEPWRLVVRASERLMTAGRIGDRPAIHRLVFPLRDAPFVTRPVRFAANEWLRRRAVTRHRLRGTDLVAHVRHPYHDIWVLDEIFAKRVYAPPGPVRAALESLDRPPRIVDVGGHVGLASLFFLSQFPEAEITALEPDPHNASIFRRSLAANGLDGRMRLVQAAAGVRDGSADFVSDYHLSRIGVAEHAATTGVRVPLVDVLPHMAEADLVKLDLQGGEWEVLADPRAKSLRTRAIVLEYHPWGSPTDDPHADARRLLREAGFEVGDPFEVHAGEGTVWAWKRAAGPTP